MIEVNILGIKGEKSSFSLAVDKYSLSLNLNLSLSGNNPI